MQLDHWGVGDPMMILGRILERTETTIDAVQEISGRVSRIEHRLIQGDERMNRIEDKQQSPSQPPWHWLLEFLKEVASFKEWATGALLIALALKGLLSPAEVKAFLLGAGPK